MTKNGNSTLAVIGMGIAGISFTGMDQFSYEIYRGRNYTGNPRKLSMSEAFKNTLEQISQTADIRTNRPLVVLMNERLVDLTTSIFPPNSVISMAGSSLDEVISQTTSLLQKPECPIILLIDLYDDTDTVSALLLSHRDFCEENHIKPAGYLTPSSGYERERTNLMVINGKVQEFIHNPISRTMIPTPHEMDSPSCALVDSLPGLFAVLKLLTCQINHFIPGVFDWNEIDSDGIWSSSVFYVPGNSRSWFSPASQSELCGSVVTIADSGKLTFINLCTPVDFSQSHITMPSMEELCIFPFGGNSIEEILSQLAAFKNTNFSRVNLQQAARFQYRRWLKGQPTFSACILGNTPEDLLREIEYAITGIPESAEKSTDWRTPAGSTFSPVPQGKTGSITFVYPGAFNSYPGVGQDLFKLFPILFRRLSEISENIGDLINERQLYPRRFDRILPADMEQLEKDLVSDPLAMLISGTCLAAVYTFLLRETFDLHPSSSLGYSLGEISMMFASGVWTKADETARALRNSPLFHNRMAGNQDAVREYWRKNGNFSESADGRLWANFILMASYDKVANAVQQFDHVYVTHINTPRQVVIGGHPDECRQLISSIKCSSLEAPFNYALHCSAVESEFEALRELHYWPVQNQPGMTLYSAATNAPLSLDQENIARQIAYGLCHRLDFPRLVETAYDDGARIFIELGAGSNCTRWIDESLAGKPHMALSINRKGVDDHASILQMLARLITHGVPVNLTPIFG